MIVRSLDSSNDWTFGKGRADYLTLNNAIAQCIQTRLSTFLGECFFNVTVGVDWWNLLGYKNQSLLNLQCSTIILNTFGVTGVFNLSFNLQTNRNLSITYNATTIYPGGVAGNILFLTTQQGDQLTDQDGNPLIG